MVQGMFHGQVNIQAGVGVSLVDTVRALNAFICTRAPKEKYVTMAVLRYVHSESGDADIELVNGGHVAPLIVRADGKVELIRDGDLPVGLFEFAQFHTVPLRLAVGDRIVLLSDGITEAEDVFGAQFGLARLEQHLAHRDPVGALFSAIDKFSQGTHPQDDQTVLAIRRTA
jgi:serine phosphatase RsbU (regulator of sigma subunit)